MLSLKNYRYFLRTSYRREYVAYIHSQLRLRVSKLNLTRNQTSANKQAAIDALSHQINILKQHFNDRAQKAFIEDEKKRSVATFVGENDVVFLHGISKNHPSINSLIGYDVDFLPKFQICLSLQPTLCATAFDENLHCKHLWAPHGVIIIDGRIDAAEKHDAATKPLTHGKRKHSKDSLHQDPAEQFRACLPSRNLKLSENGHQEYDYNEFNISQPVVAGIYLSITEDNTPVSQNVHVIDGREYKFLIDEILYNPEEILAVSRRYNAPIYLVRGSKFYKGTYDLASRKFINLTPVRAPQINQCPALQLDENQTNKAIDDILDAKAFINFSPEVKALTYRQKGFAKYLEFTNMEQVPKGLIGPCVCTVKQYIPHRHDFIMRSYSFTPKGLKIETTEIKENLHRPLQRLKYRSMLSLPHEDRSYCYTNDEGKFNFEHPVYPIIHYCDSDTATKNGFIDALIQAQRILINHKLSAHHEAALWTAFYLHGIADAAQLMKDQEIAHQARFCANLYVGYPTYRAVLDRRLVSTASGDIKHLKTDLPLFGRHNQRAIFNALYNSRG